MPFKARQFLAAALVVSLLIQMHIAASSYAARGTKIAFTCLGVDGNRDICVMDGDGGNEVRLTDNPGFDAEPSWSPDGNRIAFNRGHHIYVMDSDGQNLMQLSERFTDREPAWSPDGEKIAFNRFTALKHQVWVMDADGGNQIQLTQWGSNYNPAWSPDGVRIAFVSAKRHAEPEIYAMDSDGGNQVRLTHDLRTKDRPSWSPDGQWIAYDDSFAGWLSQISVVAADGSGRTKRLTDNPPTKWFPAWSPDGNTIAYVAWVDKIASTIELMTTDGNHLKQLSEDGTWCLDLDWFDPTAWSVSQAAGYPAIWGEIKRPTSGR